MEFVSWDDDIPNIRKNGKSSSHHQPEVVIWYLIGIDTIDIGSIIAIMINITLESQSYKTR